MYAAAERVSDNIHRGLIIRVLVPVELCVHEFYAAMQKLMPNTVVTVYSKEQRCTHEN
jgi:hypothetical protein